MLANREKVKRKVKEKSKESREKYKLEVAGKVKMESVVRK